MTNTHKITVAHYLILLILNEREVTSLLWICNDCIVLVYVRQYINITKVCFVFTTYGEVKNVNVLL